MGGKGDIEPIPDIRPFGMMILCLCEQRNPRHKSEAFGKVSKEKPAADCIARFIIVPLIKPVDQRGAVFIA
jgi:hypothetical protein